MLWDHGAYFGKSADTLTALLELVPSLNLRVVMEHTQNGLNKYDETLSWVDPLPAPAVSVAKTPVKDIEDQQTGAHIVDSVVKSIASERGASNLNSFLAGSPILVIGAGKIGAGIAKTLLEEHAVNNVHLVDPNLELLERVAETLGYARTKYLFKQDSIADIPDTLLTILNTAKIIFSATGRAPLHPVHLNVLAESCLLVGVTSAEDEFGFKIPTCSEESGSPRRLQEYTLADSVLVHGSARADGKKILIQDGGLTPNLIDAWPRKLWIAIIQLLYVKMIATTKLMKQVGLPPDSNEMQLVGTFDAHIEKDAETAFALDQSECQKNGITICA